MKKLILFCIFTTLSYSSFAEDKWSNDQNSGKNKLQRINANADKLAQLIQEVATLRSEVDALKQKVQNLGATAGKEYPLAPPENSQ